MHKGKKEKLAGQVLAAIAAGMSVSGASRKFKVSRASIYVWRSDDERDRESNIGKTVARQQTDNFILPTAESKGLEKKIKDLEIEYEELLSVAREEIRILETALNDTLGFVINIIKKPLYQSTARPRSEMRGLWYDYFDDKDKR